MCRRFGTLCLFHLHRHEDGTYRVFRNVGTWNSEAGELPRRKHTTYRTRRKFEIKNYVAHLFTVCSFVKESQLVNNCFCIWCNRKVCCRFHNIIPLAPIPCHVVLVDVLPSYFHFNPLNAELNPICYLLALLAHHFLHVSRIRVESLTLRLLMSYICIYGAPILDVSRSHTTTQHSR